MIIQTFLVCVSFGNKSCLVLFDDTIKTMLDLIDPFASNGMLTQRQGGDGRYILMFQSMDLCYHASR